MLRAGGVTLACKSPNFHESYKQNSVHAVVEVLVKASGGP